MTLEEMFAAEEALLDGIDATDDELVKMELIGQAMMASVNRNVYLRTLKIRLDRINERIANLALEAK